MIRKIFTYSNWVKWGRFYLGLVVALMLVLPAGASLLDDKNTELQNIRKKIDAQQKTLDSVSQRKQTLKNQIELIDGQIALGRLQLEALGTQIDEINARMLQINGSLVDAEIEMYQNKQVLGSAIKEAYMRRQVGVLEVVVGSDNLSAFMSQMEYISAIESKISSSISSLKQLNDALKLKKSELEQADKQMKDALASKQVEQKNLDTQMAAKENILSDVTLTEVEYQKRLSSSLAEQNSLEAEIAKLAASSRKNVLNQGKYSLDWPISSRRITATFHDSDYYSHFHFVHQAIDIATPQGTPIKAPADAYVMRVKFDGSTKYSYVMLDHGNGMVSVYGHVSAVMVTNGQFVPSGTVIALTGATPFTVGAGLMTTGPHLHFEVWLNGEAKNPLNYLI